MCRCALIALLSLTASFAIAQSFTVFNYTVAEGLPSSEVYEIYEDAEGFIWFGTDHGVVRFDGQEIKTFQLKDGLTDPVVFNFQDDSKGRIWFRTFSGKLCYYEKGQIIPYRYNDKLLQATSVGLIQFAYLAETDELWYSVRNRVGHIDANGNLNEEMLTDPDKRRALIYKTVGDENLIIAAQRTTDVQWIFIDDKKYPVSVSGPSYSNMVYGKARLKDKLYLSAYNDVFEYDGDTIRKVLATKHPIISLSADKDGNLWVGCLNGGVQRFKPDHFADPWQPEFLKTKSVTKTLQDKHGGYWFSTLESGVFFVPNMAIHGFNMPPNAIVKSVNQSKNYIIVNDKSGSVRFYDRVTKKVLHEKKFNYNVLSVFADAQKNFWISGHDDISIFDSTLRLKKSYPKTNAVDFFQDKDGTVWGLGSQRLYHFGKDLNLISTKVFYDVYRSMIMHDSMFFLGGRIGLDIRDKNFNEIRSVKAFENFKISDLLVLDDTTILISTIGNGFASLNTRQWTVNHFHSEKNFIANNIYTILRSDTSLWIGTEKGLAVISVSALLKNEPRFRYLNHISGLRSRTVNFLAAGDRSVWAFSDDGFSVIPDTLTKFANKIPTFYLKTITCNDQPVAVQDKIIFDHTQNNIKASFGFISFNSDEVFLRYRVTDRDPWVYTHDNTVQLTSLAPGDYQCDLEYSTDNVSWNKAHIPLSFVINPPWYKRWYIYPAGVVFLLALVYLYFKNQQSIYKQKNHYLKIINEHQQKLIQSEVVTIERERNRIAKELHDGIGTTLTAIKLRVSQLLQHHREPMATDIEDQFQTTIHEIKDIIYGLTPPSLERYGLYTALKNYVNRIRKNLPISVTLKTFGSDVSHYELNIIIFRVIQELLSNSVKHSYAKNILIHVSSFDDVISIIYEDDGIGFQYDPVQNGLGLDNIESRIQSINGTLKFDSGDFGISYNIEIPVNLKQEPFHERNQDNPGG